MTDFDSISLVLVTESLGEIIVLNFQVCDPRIHVGSNCYELRS